MEQHQNTDPSKINDQTGQLLHNGWVESSDNLGTYYRDVIRPDLSVVVRMNVQTSLWHVQFYCAATKGFVDFTFTTPARAFELGHAVRWSIASAAAAV